MNRTLQQIFTILLALHICALPTVAETTAELFIKEHKSFFHLLHPNKSEIILGALYEPKHKEDGGPGEYDLFNYFIDTDVIFPQNEDFFISTKLSYHANQFEFEKVSSLTEISSTTLHRATLSVGAGTFVTEDFLAHGEIILGAYSDFDSSLDENDFQAHGKGLLTYRINPFTQLIGGVYATDDFSSADIFPVLGFRLHSGGGKLHFSLTAPVEARVTYFLSPHTSFYLAGSMQGYEYRITAGPVDTEFDVAIHDRRVGIGALHWFNETINVGAEAGVNINAEFEFQTRGAGQFDGDTKHAMYGMVQLGFAL